MRHFTFTLIASMGLITASFLSVMADSTPASNFSGNQLTRNQTHWYEQAAASTGPVSGITAKGGALLSLQTGSFLYLEGDSTLHKYQMNAHSLLGSAVVKTTGGDLVKALKAGSVDSMTLVVPVNNLKSREKGLDDNAYQALKTKENQEIQFVLKSETLKPGKETGSYVMAAKGTLKIAGTTSPITLTADTMISGNRIRLKGTQKLKMTDFKVAPPSISLLVTSIKCSDEVEIHYDVVFELRK